MKNTYKLVALILTFLMLAGSTVAYAGTYVSDPFSPNISKPSAPEQPGAEDPKPEGEATPAPEDEVAPDPEGAQASDDGEDSAPGEQPDEEAPETGAVVTTKSESGRVNIRAAASKDAEIIGHLSNNDRVAVLGTEGDWTRVRAGELVGYVHSRYLQAAAPEGTPAPVETKREVRVTSTLGSVVNEGDKATLTGKLIGFEDVEVELQWQYNDGRSGGWKDVQGALGERYSYTVSPENINYGWRLMVKIVG